MYEELVKECRDCLDSLCGECKYENLQKPGNFVPCMNALLRETADAIEELSNSGSIYGKAWTLGYDAGRDENRPRWIPVTERLPEEDTDALVVRKFLGVKGQVPSSTYVEIASRYEDDWIAATDEYKIARSKHTNPLYWMPIPEPPKEE